MPCTCTHARGGDAEARKSSRGACRALPRGLGGQETPERPNGPDWGGGFPTGWHMALFGVWPWEMTGEEGGASFPPKEPGPAPPLPPAGACPAGGAPPLSTWPGSTALAELLPLCFASRSQGRLCH